MIPAALDPAAPDLALRVAVVVLLTAAATVAMEFWAAVLHEKVWHGRLWIVHRSHHRPRAGALEANDIFALVNGPPAVALMAWGMWGEPGLATAAAYAVGAGISVYGVAYLLVHDGFVHQRLPLGFLARSRWMRAVRTAHRVHHADGGAPYGLFLGTWELERRRRRLQARSNAAASVGMSTDRRHADRRAASSAGPA